MMMLQVFFPEQEFPELFQDVLRHRLFPDNKTFPDAIPKASSSLINKQYAEIDKTNTKAVFNFVHDWFDLPETTNLSVDTQHSVEDHIKSLWPKLTRQDLNPNALSSKIHLPYKYVVPGGRFREMYYWDSYFTMLGLLECGHANVAVEMIQNFAWMIVNIGHIPNGNRSYFLSRSQPPFFALMVRLFTKSPYSGIKSVEQFKELLENNIDKVPIALFNKEEHLNSLLLEYEFWMDGIQRHETAFRRIVKLNDGLCLNRYYDDLNAPRVESYSEDLQLFHDTHHKQDELFRNLRAACESGWDFSSRWCMNPDQLNSILTTQILPVDLNVLMYFLEKTISELYHEQENYKKSALFDNRAKDRSRLINKWFWNEHEGYYADYWMNTQQSGVPTLAMSFPLFAGIASQQQAERTANYLENHFLKPGGWVTTLNHTGHQWDAPNGWPPLQWITFVGLKNYGYTELAQDAARRWLQLNEDVFKRTGRMMEKYNVEDLTLEAGGGEYPVQDGFGWTNGVYIALKNEL